MAHGGEVKYLLKRVPNATTFSRLQWLNQDKSYFFYRS